MICFQCGEQIIENSSIYIKCCNFNYKYNFNKCCYEFINIKTNNAIDEAREIANESILYRNGNII